jgi:hypothetical protein
MTSGSSPLLSRSTYSKHLTRMQPWNKLRPAALITQLLVLASQRRWSGNTADSFSHIASPGTTLVCQTVIRMMRSVSAPRLATDCMSQTIPNPAVGDVCLRLEAPHLSLPLRPDPATGRVSGFQIAFFTRMLFSCLIDADRTATEKFCNPEGARSRAQERPSLRALKDELDAHLARKQAWVEATPVNRIRAHVLSECREAALHPPGFSSLQVPTGGGKTYSSLAFALDHAACFDLGRVVVAIPFTSIIEQTAAVYREALGPHAERGLIEHHTNIQPVHDTRSNQIGAENWDARG